MKILDNLMIGLEDFKNDDDDDENINKRWILSYYDNDVTSSIQCPHPVRTS